MNLTNCFKAEASLSFHWQRENVHISLIYLGNAKSLKSQQTAHSTPTKYEKLAIQLHLQSNAYNLSQMNNSKKTPFFEKRNHITYESLNIQVYENYGTFLQNSSMDI